MAFKVVWTTSAEFGYQKILEYLIDEWSLKIAEEFAVECLINIELITSLPSIGTVSEKNPLVRKILISKHNFLYYKFEDNLITLLNFFDTRQDPSKNPFG